MDTSFYTATRGVVSYQEKLNVISNNIANVNTNGYKAKNAVFSDLMYYNMHDTEGAQSRIKAGTGSIVGRTDINFDQAGYAVSGGAYDCAISGEGFFMVQHPVTNEIAYTRNGCFSLSQRADGFYLVSDSNKLVLDRNQAPIRVVDGELQSGPGVYTFASFNGMQSVGENEFAPVAKNGPPILLPNAEVVTGVLELSNTDMASEMSKTIETSRAYSLALKMIQTSDEVEQTINSLRS